MADVVVTVPKGVWLEWLLEGDCAGTPPTGQEWGYHLGGASPNILPGERVYVVAHGRLRGYAPLTRKVDMMREYVLCREGNAVACTIPAPIPGFRGWRLPFWKREDEIPFPGWMFVGVVARNARERDRLALLRQSTESP